MEKVIEAIESAGSDLRLYENALDQLNEGLEWSEVDTGLRDVPSEEFWEAYMTGRLINNLRVIVLEYERMRRKRRG